MDGIWRIELMGRLRVIQGDRILTRFRTRKTGGLFAYMAFYAGRRHFREELMELFWPESDPALGRRSLRMALSSLRRQLEPPGTPPGSVILADRSFAWLNPEACVTDVTEFEQALRAAERADGSEERVQQLTRAVELYQGELLPGFFEEWVLQERQRLAEAYFQALEWCIVHLEQRGDLPRALQIARRAVAADPLREGAHRELMRLYVAVGQPAAALRQYRELERILQRELGAVPDEASRALARELEGHASIGVDTHAAEEVQPQTGAALSGPAAALAGGPPPGPNLLRRWDASGDAGPCLGPVGGAVPPGSSLYVVRPIDEEFQAAVSRGDSIVLVKGTRQVGKSSLLARGLHQARLSGSRVMWTDFQRFNAVTLDAPERLLLALAQSMADQLALPISPAEGWVTRRGPNSNLEWYLEHHVIGSSPTPVVWALDQVDRLFSRATGPDLFGMFRAWHNERALDPEGPWSRLTLAIAYATEAHLFIPDDDQSPFNVGTRLTLADFTREQVAELNCRYGLPLQGEAALRLFCDLVGGHPYLVHRGLHEIATRRTSLPQFEQQAATEEGIYSAHLRRLRALLTRDAELFDAMRQVLQGRPCPTPASFYRLRSAGAVAGESGREARPRCRLYALYLERHLPTGPPGSAERGGVASSF